MVLRWIAGVTVAILAQGTSWAVAVTQALDQFLLEPIVVVKEMCCDG